MILLPLEPQGERDSLLWDSLTADHAANGNFGCLVVFLLHQPWEQESFVTVLYLQGWDFPFLLRFSLCPKHKISTPQIVFSNFIQGSCLSDCPSFCCGRGELNSNAFQAGDLQNYGCLWKLVLCPFQKS